MNNVWTSPHPTKKRKSNGTDSQHVSKHHIMKAINENLDDDAKKVLDQAISDDKGHNKNSLSDLLG